MNFTLQLAELGLLPEGDDDPLALAEKLTQLAIDANDDQVGSFWREMHPAGSTVDIYTLMLPMPSGYCMPVG